MKLLTLSFLLLFFLFGSNAISGQKITGIWRGYFITETGEEYRLEFQVEQKKAQSVSGVSYSYLDKRFYGKATMIGNFAVKDNSFQIQELRTTEVRSTTGGGTCLMNYKFTYAKSGKEEFLEGTYLGKSEDRKNPKNNGVWGDCGGGRVYLRRVETSDFYVESFLRDKPVVKKTTTSQPKTNNKTTAQTPVKKTPAVTQKQPTATATTKPPVKKETAIQKPKNTQVQKLPTDIVKEEPKKVIVPKTISIPSQTRARENELTKTLTVRNEEVIVKLYDNGEIDDDTISVYLDNNLVLSNKRLSAAPLTINLKMSEDDAEHVLVMVAENLGKIPPNTSLMIVNDGDKRYEVRITSTDQKNAMVRFRYQKTIP
ncbi:MAG: hypothetical protein ABR503_01350 [Chitinophagaceae bacterium]